MTTEQKKIMRNYKRELRRLFPLFTKNEKRFFNILNGTLLDYSEEYADFTRESLDRDIGKPKEIVARYLMDMEEDTLKKALTRTKYVKVTLLILIATIISTGAYKIWSDYTALVEARNSYIHREIIETVIEPPISEEEVTP